MKRSFSRYAVVALSLLLGLGLTGCGGGGGGGDGGAAPPPPVTYSGNTNPAVITVGNAAKLTANVVGSGDAAAIIVGASIESSAATQKPSSGVTDLVRRLNHDFHASLLQPSRASSAQRLAPAAIPVDETEPCDSGSVRTFGTLDDDGTGTLTVIYNDCRIDDDVLSGQATLRVDAFDLAYLVPTDVTFSFSRLTLRGSGVSADISGSLRSQLSVANNTEIVTANIVSLDNITGEMTKAENLVFVNVYNNILFPSSFTETIDGRVFHSIHGYVISLRLFHLISVLSISLFRPAVSSS